MRTVEDLRVALAAREDLAPDATEVLSGMRRRGQRTIRRGQRTIRRGRRATGVAVAVAMTVAAAVVVAVPLTAAWRSPAGPGPNGHGPAGTGPAAAASTGPGSSLPAPPSGHRPPFSFTLQRVTVAGFDIEPTAVSADTQIASVRPVSGSAQPATLYLYDPGSQNGPRSKAEGQLAKVMVNGAPAWVDSDAKSSTVSWEYAPGAWALLSSAPGPAMSRQTLVALAEGVRHVAGYQVKVPYRLGFLPAGFAPFHVVQRVGAASVVQLEQRPDGGRVMDISVLDGPRASGAERPEGWQPTRTIAGHPAVCTDLIDGRRCAVDFGQFTVDIGGGALDNATVERIVAGMSFAAWRDLSTWYDLDRALPAR
jgi:hypothetical protein